jgi:SAM-dependent methyltransferase
MRWKAPNQTQSRKKTVVQVVFAIGLVAPIFSITPQFGVRYLPFDEVRDLIGAMVNAGAPDVPAGDINDAVSWNGWIQARDREIRGRIDRGIEDSISNLILFGTSYSQLPPIPTAADGADPSGQLTPAARARVHALAQAMLQPGENERVRFARDFLVRRNMARDSTETYLARNLRRLIRDERDYENKQRAARQSGDPDALLMIRATIYKERGLSFDTSLEPDFALDTMLKQLVQKGLVARGSVRRIAVIGPGLDFADKRIGLDFYPIQTIQPFAIMESVLRLGLGQAEIVRVVACDLNPSVLAHVRRLARRGQESLPYVVQLPNDSRNEWPPELVSYWQHFGELLGTPTRPFGPPGYFKGVKVRAVAIRPQFAEHVSGQDLNMVTQQLDVPPADGFDLVIATNVFVYYNFFEQALAMQNISRMMNSGGIFLVNQILSNQHPDSLKLIDQCNVSFNAKGLFGDDVVAYQQQ